MAYEGINQMPNSCAMTDWAPKNDWSETESATIKASPDDA